MRSLATSGVGRVPHPVGAVSAAHPLAVEAGADVLRAGGTAVDAAICAQAVVAVVMPEAGGLGGDMLALVHEPAGAVVALTGSGALPARAQGAASTGGASVTVPGLADAWIEAHTRYGRLPLADVLAAAVRLAEDGVPVEPDLAEACAGQRSRLLAGGAQRWALLGLAAGERWRQPELVRTLRAVAAGGREAFYAGAAAASICAAVRRHGGAMEPSDLQRHATDVAVPLEIPWAGGRLAVQPPMSQGVLLAMAAQWVDRHAASAGPDELDHLMVEATEAAFAHRDDCARGAALLDEPLAVDRDRASGRGGPRAYLHTAGVAAADRDGMVVSSLISVFDDFGSGVYVPELGFVLNNRAGGFTAGRNAAAPGRRPVHTLAPGLARLSDGTVLGLATPGADGQVQTLLQVLAALRGGTPLAAALAAPRWRSENTELLIEDSHPQAAALADRGHRLRRRGDGDPVFGAVVAAGVRDGVPFAAADTRRRVAAAAVSSEPTTRKACDGASGS